VDSDTHSANPCAVWEDPRPTYYASIGQGQQNYSNAPPPPLINSSSYPSQSQSASPYPQSQSTYDQYNQYGQQQNSYGSQQYSQQPSHNQSQIPYQSGQPQQKDDKGFLGNLMNSVNGKQNQTGTYGQSQRSFWNRFPSSLLD